MSGFVMRTRSLVLLAVALVVSPAACATAGASVRFLNWIDYIDEATLPEFERSTGVVVRYETFDDVEVARDRLRRANGDIDLAIVSLQDLASPSAANLFQPIDKAKLSNIDNLDPVIQRLAARVDRGNSHGIPYLWGTVGLGFDADKVPALAGTQSPGRSWEVLFDPARVSRLKDCGVSLLDRPAEMFALALNYLKLDPNSRSEADLDRAQALLASIRPYVSHFDSSGYIDRLAKGDVCLAVGWSGDVFLASKRALHSKARPRVDYAVPHGGTLVWVDLLAIPASAQHAAGSHRLIDHVLRPEVMARISSAQGHASPNLASRALLDAALATDIRRYPLQCEMPAMFVLVPPSAAEAAGLERRWLQLKSR